MLAVIGGSGLSRLPEFELTHRRVMRTPYGEPSGAFLFGKLFGHDVVFLARHGYGHTIAPHEINYRANLWAIGEIGVDGVVSVASVGAINPKLSVGQLVIPDQILDYTWGRAHTFFEGEDVPVKHIDFTWPYDATLRQSLATAAEASEKDVFIGGAYACTQGPRLETAAEIKRLARDGADIVGMTGMPEAALARELEIPYAHLALVVNAGAGIGDSAEKISHSLISQVVTQGMSTVMDVIRSLLELRST